MKTVAAIVLAFFGLVLFGCHEVFKLDREQHVSDQQWAQFSAQHHCKTLRDEKWWESSVVWQCYGGFQVKRRDSE